MTSPVTISRNAPAIAGHMFEGVDFDGDEAHVREALAEGGFPLAIVCDGATRWLGPDGEPWRCRSLRPPRRNRPDDRERRAPQDAPVAPASGEGASVTILLAPSAPADADGMIPGREEAMPELAALDPEPADAAAPPPVAKRRARGAGPQCVMLACSCPITCRYMRRCAGSA